jgi:hypothetical protein
VEPPPAFGMRRFPTANRTSSPEFAVGLLSQSNDTDDLLDRFFLIRQRKPGSESFRIAEAERSFFREIGFWNDIEAPKEGEMILRWQCQVNVGPFY